MSDRTDRKIVPHQLRNELGDRLDAIDREALPVTTKLRLLLEETKVLYAQDPRSGGFAIVARPRIILLMLIELLSTKAEFVLQRPIVIGDGIESDIIGWFCDVPIRVRSTVSDDNVHCLRSEMIPSSLRVDRQRAGQLRMAAHSGTESLNDLKEN